MKKIDILNKKLKQCKCGGEVKLIGGTPWNQMFSIACNTCNGRWNMNTYSPKEAAEKWGTIE